MRIDSSSGKSIGRRLAICAGLMRWPIVGPLSVACCVPSTMRTGRQPHRFRRGSRPRALPVRTLEEVRVQRVWLPWVALPQDRLSIAQLMCGTRACRRGWQRCGGVLARSSTVIAPIWSAISRMLIPFARSRAISSRSVKVRYLEGIAASIGSVGDAYDNALAESTIWVVQDRGSIEEKPVPERPARDHRRCRVRHDGMGRLVQPTPPPTAPWTTSHQTNSRRSTTVKNRLSARRCCKRRSGKKPGTVH